MFKFSDRIKDLNGTATREIFKLLSRPEIISFAGGMPATVCLPCETVRLLADEIIKERGAYVLQYGRTEGCDEFNEQAKLYLDGLGITAEAGGLQVLSGGQQGLDLMCKAFLNKGDTVLVENPTYLAFLQIVKTYEANAVGVDANTDGLVISDLEAKIKKHAPKLLYTVPDFSNPTGKTYSAENRKAIVELCRKHGVVVIEDDPYGRLRYDGAPVPLMKSLDEHGDTVVYITSFSKTVAPGLRVAVAAGHPDIVRKLIIGKQGTDVQNPALNQMIIAEFLRRGYFYPALEKSIAVYRTRRDAMLAALDKYMPDGVSYTRPKGGLFVWAELPRHIDTATMLPEAVKRNVAYISGTEFFADGSGANTMRLNFSNSDEERIETGVRTLAELIKSKL